MQAASTLDIALIGIPGLFIGLMIGYIVGSMSSLRVVDRIGLGIAISGIGGLILSLVIGFYIPITTTFEILFVILAFAGGYGLGLFLNWKPPIKSGPKSHIIYEPDDDDAFDKEIEEALGSKD